MAYPSEGVFVVVCRPDDSDQGREQGGRLSLGAPSAKRK
jgi:hypothetical protein